MQDEHNEFTLFPLREEDVSELAALEAACFPTPWSEEQYRKILKRNGLESPAPGKEAAVYPIRYPEKADAPTPSAGIPEEVPRFPSTPVFGMRAATGELAAYICLGVYQRTRELEIYNIAVSTRFRKQGLGKRLLSHALEEARSRGIERALLEVRPSNDAALALYASAGFAICGNRKKYYRDSGEDALILACDLAPRII